MNVFVSVRSIDFNMHGNSGKLHWEYPINFHPRTQYVDFAMTFVLKRLRLGTGAEWSPVAVEFEHREPDDLSEYARVFGRHLLFNTAESAIVIENQMLSRPMPTADHQLYQIIESFCDRLIDERPSEGAFIRNIRLSIVKCLANGQSTIEDIAEFAELEANHIKRELEKIGVTFQFVLGDTRLALADRYLRDTDLPLTDVALLLGFSELSAFSRACGRWFNMPPSSYRKLNQSAHPHKS